MDSEWEALIHTTTLEDSIISDIILTVLTITVLIRIVHLTPMEVMVTILTAMV
jgi:hypothetical protein